MAVVWFSPRPIFEAAAFALLFAVTEELIGLSRAGGIAVPRWPTTAVTLLTLATFSGIVGSFIPQLTVDAVLLIAMMAMAFVAMSQWRGGSYALAQMSASLFPSLYLALPIGSMSA